MSLESLAFGDSAVHRMDPRLRVAFLAGFSLVVAISDRFPVLIAAYAAGLFFLVLARLPMGEVVKRVFLVNLFTVFLWLVVPFTQEGDSFFAIGPFSASSQGLALCARITLKTNAIIMMSLAMAATMTIASMGHALIRIKAPAKLVHLLLLTYRYIFVIEQEYAQLARAARMRNFTPGTNMHTYRTYAYMMGMLFVRASARGRRVHQAMLCRGFSGKFYCLDEFSYTIHDKAWAVVFALLVLGLGIFQWTPILT